MFRYLDRVPPALLDAKPNELQAILGGPTVISLKGQRNQPLFVGALLHGNEPAGFQALQKIWHKYRDQALPRSLIMFIGNVRAASLNQRFCDGQVDFNRIWNGGSFPEATAATQLLDYLKSSHIVASVDVHSNSGLNPHYACIASLEHTDINLASLFNHIAVYTNLPATTLTNNVRKIAPALTLECGKFNDPTGCEHAARLIDALLHMERLPSRPPNAGDITLYRSLARLKVDPAIPLHFGADIQQGVVMRDDLDHLNFSQLAPGTILGHYFGNSLGLTEEFLNPETVEDSDILDRTMFVTAENGTIKVARHFVPAMLTTNVEAVRQDCLGYVMEEVKIP